MGLVPEQARVVCYIRVSSEEQTKGYSPEAQKDALMEWINDENWDFKKWYIEDGISGDHEKIDKRVKLQELREDAKNNNFDALLVWNLDRLSRDVRDTLEILDELKKEDIRLLSYDMKSIDFWNYTGRMVITNQSAFNEFFLAQLKEKVKMGVGKKQKGGEAHGRTPYGFQRVSDFESGRARNTRNEVNQEEMDVIRRMSELHQQNLGYSAIGRELDKAGLSPRGMNKNAKKTWNPATIRSVLNRFYEKRDEYPI
jgi:site-specific DNA recombinase